MSRYAGKWDRECQERGCHDLSVGTPQAATELIRQAAKALTSGQGSVTHLRATLLSNIHDLCRDHPLEGDYLGLCQALERWKASVGTEHNEVQHEIKTVAERLAAN